jgi:hypothetical protein
MFTRDNFANDGREYHYEALNRILEQRLGGTLDTKSIQDTKDAILRDITEVDGQLWLRVPVGSVNRDPVVGDPRTRGYDPVTGRSTAVNQHTVNGQLVDPATGLPVVNGTIDPATGLPVVNGTLDPATGRPV